MEWINLLTENYGKSEYVVDLQNAIEETANDLINTKNSFFEQLFPKTATWGLEMWEKALGIDVDLSKSYKLRRERIQAKLRGSGTTTKEMIQKVSSSYSNGDVEVIENPSSYSFIVKFVGTLGIPENMSDLMQTIEEIKPAHLSYMFEYTYLTFDEFDNYNKTWNQWDALNLTWDEFEVYKEG